MKSYNGLFEAMTEVEEIEASIDEAAKRKRNRGVVRKTLANKRRRAMQLQYQIRNGLWHPQKHDIQYIQEGSHRKRRNIVKPNWYHEQPVHHMVARQIAMIYGPSIYQYVAGTVKAPQWSKGHGPQFCKRAMVRWTRGERRLYVAELDIRKFFDSIDIEVLEGMYSRKIRDRRFLNILFELLETSGPGVPKGYYTSPWHGQVYLQPLDNFILQELKPLHYLRFVDNFFILHRNKRELHRMVSEIERFANEVLHLQFNDSKQIYRFEYDRHGEVRGRPINCVGYVIHRDRVTMRKSILKRARAKAYRIHRNHHCTVHDAATMLSYKGWFRQTDTYNYYQKYIKPNVSMRYCRKRVSRMAKRRNGK